MNFANVRTGDGNNDGQVDFADYLVWRANFGNIVTSLTNGDYNGNGVVDSTDYIVWRNNTGNGTDWVAAAV